MYTMYMWATAAAHERWFFVTKVAVTSEIVLIYFGKSPEVMAYVWDCMRKQMLMIPSLEIYHPGARRSCAHRYTCL